jgi:hypothetical protein
VVKDSDTGAPVENAGIYDYNVYGPPITTTDVNGGFSFELEAGTYTFSVSHDDYKNELIEDVTVVAGEAVNLGEIEIDPWGDFYSVSGTISLPEELHTVEGKYEIYITTDTFFIDGSGEVVSMLYDFENNCGFEWENGAETIEYDMDSPAGDFYIFVVLEYEDDGSPALMMGIYGGVYDTDIPVVPNATVTETDNVFDISSDSFGPFQSEID